MEQKIWWYAINNEQKGPISYDELQLLVNQNFINADTLVWKQGLPNWIKLADINSQPVSIPQIQPPVNTQPTPVVNQPQQTFTPTNIAVNQPQQTYAPSGNVNSINSNVNSAALDSYYRAEFEKIAASNETYQGKWNWWAFFFNRIWCLTKGLWQYAVVILVPWLILSFFISILLGNLYSIAVAILFGLKGTYFYYKLVNKNKQLW